MFPPAMFADMHARGGEYLVLDEAHKLLELGFLEQCDEVLAACDGSTVQRCLFSATMPPAVEDLVHPVLRQSVKVVVGEKNAAADTVEQSLVFCGREDGKLVALRQMVHEGLRPPVLSSCSRSSGRCSSSTRSCTTGCARTCCTRSARPRSARRR